MSHMALMVIDDKDFMREGLAETLQRAGYEVDAFARPVAAMEAFQPGRHALVITDLKMPEMDGIEVARRVRGISPETAVVVITGYGTIESAVTAMKEGACDYILKPFKAEQIEIVVSKALERRALALDNEKLRCQLVDLPEKELVGDGPAMQVVRRQIRQVAGSSVTVLIHGESGTGKELVARAIHAASERHDRPFLKLNCPALSTSLMESEMFGHEKGAFTGADRTRKGRFELADSGTLLLDEISEMDPRLQAKLLRVLQEKEFERVGSAITRRVDVRVIATTNRDPHQALASGLLRRDLYYRLNVVPIAIAPLRERREDIPMLAQYFLHRFAVREGRPSGGMHPDAVRLLCDYGWPGNVRELENIMERASVLDLGPTIVPDQIAAWLQPLDAVGPDGHVREGASLEEMERRLIAATLARFGGHRAKTADALGIAVRTLSSKLKRWREQGRPLVVPDVDPGVRQMAS